MLPPRHRTRRMRVMRLRTRLRPRRPGMMAMAAQTDAETARDDAVADAAAELKIDGTVKSVGDTG